MSAHDDLLARLDSLAAAMANKGFLKESAAVEDSAALIHEQDAEIARLREQIEAVARQEQAPTTVLSIGGKIYASPSVEELACGVPIPVINLKEAAPVPASDTVSVQRDADRYRWLRDHAMWIHCADDDTDKGNFVLGVDNIDSSQLDAAIDAAIAARPKP
jgi:predicted transcriptional regulator